MGADEQSGAEYMPPPSGQAAGARAYGRASSEGRQSAAMLYLRRAITMRCFP